MKRYLLLGIALLLIFPYGVFAKEEFGLNISSFDFSVNSKRDLVSNSFNKKYNLKTTISGNNQVIDEDIKRIAKKTTYLLLGKMNLEKESSEDYYKRQQDYYDLAAYKYFPKDSNTKSGYDEGQANYQYVIASELAIPQLFNTFNEVEISYNSYGDIRVTNNKGVVMVTVGLPNIKYKKRSKTNPREYELNKTNLILNYYYIMIDGEYRLCYLFGQTTEEMNKYFNQLEERETKGVLAIAANYNSSLSSLYNFEQVDKMSDEEIDNIYKSNLDKIVYLNAYYNNTVTDSANGFLISDGIVVTTWDFLEKALIKGQYFSIKGNGNNKYEVDGIITANPVNNVVVIKLRDRTNSYVKLASEKLVLEDAAITISSKAGVGLIVQKGIIVSHDNYIQTSIPLTEIDDGSPLFNKNGEVIGINTFKSNNNLSLAVNNKVLKEIQDKFMNVDFNTISSVSFEELKKEYYYVKFNDENIKNSIPDSKWKIYSKIGKIKEEIKLPLVKASYQDNIISLRYKNVSSKYINSMQLAGSFKEQLLIEGFKEVVNSKKKCIYENNKYKVIIIEEFDYLIVVMVMK